MVTEADVRAKWVEICTSYDGCSIATDPDRFCDLIAAVNPGSVRAFFSQRTKACVESSCGVVSIGLIRKLCRAFGLHVDELEQPMTPAWLDAPRKLFQRYGCEIQPGGGRMPTVGCAYYLYEPRTNAMHWRNVVDGTPGSGPFTTIDGGAKDGAGFQAIAKARPQLRGYTDVLSGKSVAFWLDAVRLVMALLAKVGAAGLPGAPVTIEGVGTSAVKGVATGGVAGAKPGQPIEGIDVASVNGVIDWKRVAKAGIQFAYVRLAIGLNTPDAFGEHNVKGALDAGIPIVGGYGVLYGRHGRAQDGDAQGRELVNLARRYGCTGRPMMDVELGLDGKPNSANAAEVTEAVKLCGLAIEADGERPLFYSYPSFIAMLKLDAWFTRWDLWQAQYAKALHVALPWRKALLWQYLASAPGFEGRVDGVPTLVDRNRLFGTLDDLRVSPPPLAA